MPAIILSNVTITIIILTFSSYTYLFSFSSFQGPRVRQRASPVFRTPGFLFEFSVAVGFVVNCLVIVVIGCLDGKNILLRTV